MVDWLTHLLLRLGLVMGRVVTRAQAHGLARRLGVIGYHVHKGARCSAIANLRVILGPNASDARVKRAARELFAHYAQCLGEVFLFSRHGRRVMSTVRESRSTEALPSSFMLTSAHFGPWEFMGAYLTRRLGIHAIVALPPHEAQERFARRLRRILGQKILPLGEAARNAVDVMRAGGIVGSATDRPLSEAGVPVQLFGREVLMAGGAARLALRANVPMVPCFMTADRTGMHCHFLDPIPCPPGRGRAAAQAMTQQFATQFEQLVRRYPEHWFVFHPVFDVPPNHCADPLRRRLQAQARDAATTRDREAICAS